MKTGGAARNLPKLHHGDAMPMQGLQNRKRCAANLRVGFDADADGAAGSRGMNIADAPVGKLRSQLALGASTRNSRSLRRRQTPAPGRGSKSGSSPDRGPGVLQCCGHSGASCDLHGAVGLGLDRTAWLQERRESLSSAPASRACSALQTTVVFGTAIPREAARRTVSSLLNARRTSSWEGKYQICAGRPQARRGEPTREASSLPSWEGPECRIAALPPPQCVRESRRRPDAGRDSGTCRGRSATSLPSTRNSTLLREPGALPLPASAQWPQPDSGCHRAPEFSRLHRQDCGASWACRCESGRGIAKHVGEAPRDLRPVIARSQSGGILFAACGAARDRAKLQNAGCKRRCIVGDHKSRPWVTSETLRADRGGNHGFGHGHRFEDFEPRPSSNAQRHDHDRRRPQIVGDGRYSSGDFDRRRSQTLHARVRRAVPQSENARCG